MTTTRLAPLNGFHVRKHRNNERAHVASNGQLPPADIFAGIGAPDELVAMVQTWHDLKVSERDHARTAAKARAAAETATADYRRAVREAIADNDDPSKVTDDTEKHVAIAKAHAQFSIDAANQRDRLGHTMGPDLEAVAPALFAAAEAEVEKSAAVLRESLASIRATWADYSAAFQLRYWLSHVAFDGGRVNAYHGSTGLPADAVAALDALDRGVTEVERLRSDEAELIRHREVNG